MDNILKALASSKKGEVISFVGAGGKTTSIFALGRELKAQGKRVLITTTMAIYDPKEYDYYFLKHIEDKFKPKEASITILGDRVLDSKLRGVTREYIDYIGSLDIFDLILVEADGSKMKSLKAPREGEPLIPLSTTKTVGLIGMDSLGKTLDEENVHRVEIFIQLVGKKLGEKIEVKDIVKLVVDPKGLFKNSLGEKILILNKVSLDKIDQALEIKNILEKDLNNIFIARYNKD